MRLPNDPDSLDNRYLSNNALYTLAETYSHRHTFQLANASAYQQARKRGLLDKICAHMHRKTRWTPEIIKREAGNYMTRKLFREGNNSAYQAAIRLKILDDVCSHMTKITKWSEAAVWICVRQCSDYNEFCSQPCLYSAAHSRHMLPEIKSYFKRSYTEQLNNMPFPASKNG